MIKNYCERKDGINLVVGAGFSGAVTAERIANILDEKVLIIDKKTISEEIHSITRIKTEFLYTNTVLTYFIQTIKRFGTMLTGFQALILICIGFWL